MAFLFGWTNIFEGDVGFFGRKLIFEAIFENIRIVWVYCVLLSWAFLAKMVR
jgi:hypothetical protein